MVDRLVNSEANMKRIAYVEQCFGSSGQPLIFPNRVLVGEGILIKMCRKKPKPRQFFLFNDILVYGSILINKKKYKQYNKQHIIALEEVRLQSADDVAEMRNGWHIISPVKSFTVYAATAMEKTDWMMHINKCVQDLRARRGLHKFAQAEPSPVWVPDDGASVCMHCRKSEFSVLNRRHHCRKCGIVCCSACSSKKFLLPQQSTKPVRVCTTCYNKLTVQSLQQPTSPDGDTPGTATGTNQDSDTSDEESSEFNRLQADFQPTFYRNDLD